MFESFLDEITKRSGGQITFEAHWGGALGTVVEHLPLIAKRGVDMGTIPLGAWPAELPLGAHEYAFPFGPADPPLTTKAMRMWWDEFPQCEGMMADNNLKTIFIYPWDKMDIMSLTPIKTLADFEGKVIMTWGYWSPKILEAVAGVMSTPAYERYMNLKQGVADIDCLPIRYQQVFKQYEIAKYHTTIDATPCVSPWRTVVNMDAWNELTPELQEIFLEVGREKELQHPKDHLTARWETREFFKEQGITFYELSEEDKTEWAEMLPDIPAEWARDMEAKGLPGWEMAQRWIEITAELGHKWSREWAVR